MYRYFKNKEEILDSLVTPVISTLTQYAHNHHELHEKFKSMNLTREESVEEFSKMLIGLFSDYRKEIIVLLEGSKNTKYENVKNQIIKLFAGNAMEHFAEMYPAEKKKINLNQIIEDSLYFFKSRCIKEGIRLELSLGPSMPEIYADPVQMNQVLVNIVVNAMQAMLDGGILSIETVHSGNEITITIKDTGIGMTKEILQQIFDPFFTTKGTDKGLGLGLSVVDGIIKSQKGKIEVSSKQGKGTEFRIKLPIDPGPEG